MVRRKMYLALLLASAGVGGCSTPFAERTDIDWTYHGVPGTISVSDPKMYRREALIDERRKEAKWLGEQLEASRTIELKPELVREVEQVTAVAAALGLSFDPAAALNYRRDKETGDLQQQIDVMKLKLQLDQLSQDADLVRAKFAAQKEPVNADPSKLGTGSVGDATAPGAAAAADQLKAAIDSLNTTLQSRLGTKGEPAALANSFVNPADIFRDRQAFGDVIRSAANGVSGDELHDLNGAALIRLNFEATAIPPPGLPRSVGVIQMTIEPPKMTSDDIERIYSGWLDYVNNRLTLRDASGWHPEWRLLNSAVADNFESFFYRFPLAGRPAADCKGPVLDNATPALADCGLMSLALPRFAGTGAAEGAFQSLSRYLYYFHLDAPDEVDRAAYQRARESLASWSSRIADACDVPSPGSATDAASSAQLGILASRIAEARIRLVSFEALQLAIRSAEQRLLDKGESLPAASPVMDEIKVRAARAQLLVSTFEDVLRLSGKCDPNGAGFERPRFFVPPSFGEALKRASKRVAIYEINPREQVQQISTTARAANSLALAISIAGSAPGSGAAAHAAGSYSHQAMGRAAMMERLPGIVGYALHDSGTYGWVVGPRATLDPNGHVDLQHSLRPYDLSVDLAVPGWWPYFSLRTVTQWAPAPDQIASGTVHGPDSAIEVPMSPNSADYAALTAMLAAGRLPLSREVRLDDLGGRVASACRPTTLLIQGQNVWRATAVLVAGRKFDGDAIAVAPDMSGILLDLPALEPVVGETTKASLSLVVLTPYGAATEDIGYETKQGGCQAGAKGGGKNDDGASIATLAPLQFAVPAKISFRVTGAKLDQIDRVLLNGSEEGKINPGKAGKSMTIDFSPEQTAGLSVSRAIKLSFFKGDDPVEEKLVEVTANHGGR